MNKETLIEVEGISRYFGEHCAITDISFSLKRGEILGFLGPNGAGKSTTMGIICGVLPASSGKVAIAGHDIIEEAVQAKSQIGFLPESPPLYLDQTVDEYLYYCGRLRRLSVSTLDTAIANTKQRCGLESVGNRLIGNLSKGYQQRVGIAQAVIHTPPVIILDEPTVGLDPNQIIEIRELICELGEDHSVILSTHILSEVQTTCNRVIIINEGKLALDENIDALHRDDKERYVTVALMNPPLPEELENIEGVISVKNLNRNSFRVGYASNNNFTQQFAEQSATCGWGLYELIPEQDTLEETFIRITRGDMNTSAEIDRSVS